MTEFNVNPQLIEEQRNALQKQNVQFKPKVEFNEKNYLNLRLNKGEVKREVKVRILTASAENFNPFLVLHTHSLKVSPEISKSGFKSFICLNDEHLKNEKGCPLCEKAAELLEESNKCTDPNERKALFKAAMSYKPKQTFIVRVIERGHEEDGVKFWRFNAHSDGKGIYDELMELFTIRNKESVNATGEPYNMFDLYNGKDIIITLSLDTNTGKTSIKIADAGFQTPLSKSDDQLRAWVTDPKTWSDIYASKSYEYLKIVADGQVPFYDKEKGSWVAKPDREKEETVYSPGFYPPTGITQSSSSETHTTVTSPIEDEDLPF